MRINRTKTLRGAAIASILLGALSASLAVGSTPAAAAPSCPGGTERTGPYQIADGYGTVNDDGSYNVPWYARPVLALYFNGTDPLYADSGNNLSGTVIAPVPGTGELVSVTFCKPDGTPPTEPTTPPTTTPPTTTPTTTPGTTEPAPPVTTAPVTTAPVTTAPVTTAPVTTAPVTTAPATTEPGAPVTTLEPAESTTTTTEPTAVGPGEGTTPGTTTPTPVTNLPSTGISNGITAALALAFLAIGAMLTLFARRPETELDDIS